jgi:Leucyl/phenylalanyl-tRNA protein transferase
MPDFKYRKNLNESDNPEEVADFLVTVSSKSDFCWSLCFYPGFIQRLLYSGFLPIAANIGTEEDPLYVLLPKLHNERCILSLLGSASSASVHVPKKVKKLSKRFSLELNVSPDVNKFDLILEKIQSQHNENSWLVTPYVNSIKLLLLGDQKAVKFVCVSLFNSAGVTEASESDSDDDSEESPRIVAGELGVLIGCWYISLTGFSDKKDYPNSGKIQILAMAGKLKSMGCEYIDFGMMMDYKEDLGAMEISRGRFLSLFRQQRRRKIESKSGDAELFNARHLIDSLTN